MRRRRFLGTYVVVLCSLGLPEQDSPDLGLHPELVTLVAISVRLLNIPQLCGAREKEEWEEGSSYTRQR